MAYTMPKIYLGQTVFWYPDGHTHGTEPLAAIVTKIGNENVNLNLLSPTSYNFMIRDGVRHITDPKLRDLERREMGAWGYSDYDREVLGMGKRKEEVKG